MARRYRVGIISDGTRKACYYAESHPDIAEIEHAYPYIDIDYVWDAVLGIYTQSLAQEWHDLFSRVGRR